MNDPALMGDPSFWLDMCALMTALVHVVWGVRLLMALTPPVEPYPRGSVPLAMRRIERGQPKREDAHPKDQAGDE